MRTAVIVLFLFAFAVARECREEDRVLVIATHPDDEVICCAGVISRAASRGMCVRVVVLTNGEYFGPGVSRGLERQAESVAALTELGLSEDDVVFLGYPDAYLFSLLEEFGSPASGMVTKHGINETFGNRGRGRADFHFSRTGKHAPLNAPSILEDVVAAVREFRPTHVFVSASDRDSHKDHRATHKIAMMVLTKDILAPRHTIHATIVHNSEKNWPNHIDPTLRTSLPSEPPGEPFIKIAERIDVPLSMATPVLTKNLKFRAVRVHQSQIESGCSLLLRFLHRDEIFWVRSLEEQRPPIVDAGDDRDVCMGSVVTLDGTRSIDSHNLKFSWVQSSGPAVFLNDAKTAHPRFVAPSEPTQLEFELVVQNAAGFRSFPDAVAITVLPPNVARYGPNVARNATAKASSERRYTDQTASAAIDGVVDGLLRTIPTIFGDAAREWKARESEGVWIELTWPRPVRLGKVVLHDRITCFSHVLAGILSFSDGSSINVDALDDIGTAKTIEFPPRIVTSMRFTITKAEVTPQELGTGLAEILAFELQSDLMCPFSKPVPTPAPTDGPRDIPTVKPNVGTGKMPRPRTAGQEIPNVRTPSTALSFLFGAFTLVSLAILCAARRIQHIGRMTGSRARGHGK